MTKTENVVRLGAQPRLRPPAAEPAIHPQAVHALPLRLQGAPAALATEALVRPHVFLLLDQFTHLAFSCAIEPLRLANHAAGRTLYSWSTCSLTGAAVSASNGIAVTVDEGLRPLTARETLIVVGGTAPWHNNSAVLSAWLRRQQAHGVRIIGICGATSVLARAGLIQDQRCAVHWEIRDAFAEFHPDIDVVDGTFAIDRVMTVAGGAAAADLMLHLIGAEHGAGLAGQVADQMIYSGTRGPLAPQTTMQPRGGQPRNPALLKVLRLMDANLEDPLPMSDIARRVGMSVRQIERLFLRHLDQPPHRHYFTLRMRKARNLLSQTDMPITAIAMACGFAAPSHFSKKYREQFGISAHQDRKRTDSADLGAAPVGDDRALRAARGA